MRDVAKIFLRLGCLGFGGPIAFLAMLEEEFVRRHRWVTPERFAEIIAVCKLLPGPIATQAGITLAVERAGRWAGFVAGLLTFLPAFVLVMGLSHLYTRYGTVPEASSALRGMQAAALAAILTSVGTLFRPHLRRAGAYFTAGVSFALTASFPRWEPLVILGFGLIGVLRSRASRPAGSTLFEGVTAATGSLVVAAAAPAALAATVAATPSALFWTCLKAGALVFGSGLAIVPLLESEVVRGAGWLTQAQFLDGVAIGQVTPGPVVITATFIGYVAGGPLGAVTATIGMFLPAFINTLVIVPALWRGLRGSTVLARFSGLAVPAVVGAILSTSFQLGLDTLVSAVPLTLFGVSYLALVALRAPGWLVLPLSGAASLLAARLGLG